MCGIIGIAGNKNACQIVVDGLKKLEYRGYDSAGLATFQNQKIVALKHEGKIANLQHLLNLQPLNSNVAIGHTRWATHGKPSNENAHPHQGKFCAVVHNGIIENFAELKQQLTEDGIKFYSQTDTEVLPHLFEKYFLQYQKDLKKTISALKNNIVGTYALAIVLLDNPNIIIFAKQASPLVIGKGIDENFIASDYYGIANHTNQIITIEDGDFGYISAQEIIVFNQENQLITREFKTFAKITDSFHKNGFEHFMLKEIYEQPKVLEETIETYLDLNNYSFNLPNFPFDCLAIDKITIVACGTSYYAGLIGKHLLETFVNINVEVDIASEFRYRQPHFSNNNLIIFISQSGETADTLASLKYALQHQQKTMAIVNVSHSNIAMLADCMLRTVAGPEIGVASTKAYTAQIAVLTIFAIYLAFYRKNISVIQKKQLISELIACVIKSQEILQNINIQNIAQKLTKCQNIIYTGRLISHITALESALKFRELTYINAYGIACGELKHGTIAIIDNNVYSIAIACDNLQSNIFDKTLSNLQEIKARGGKIIVLTNHHKIQHVTDISSDIITIPATDGFIQEAILPIIPMQILAYQVALLKGNDIDQPRNLAKSVTVE
jgi:glucosamine--fructose-6-phosphate aminotransferase (isomerizing)